ncbi:response regulator [Bacteroidota bacterium]
MNQKASVLVVDDNSDLLNTFSLILKMKGFNVDTAENGLSAVDKFKRRPFDVILMDLIMPQMNGVEAFRKIREINPGARVILMTAYYEEDEIRAALNEGAYQAVHKPVNVARLMQVIGEATMNSPVLVVDDDADFRRTMARALELNGYRVDAAGSGEEALQIAKERDCQVAFIDVKMPCMDGLETYQRLKEINSSMRTVMMTGYGDEVTDIVARALAAKVTTCLRKPFDLSTAMGLISPVKC